MNMDEINRVLFEEDISAEHVLARLQQENNTDGTNSAPNSVQFWACSRLGNADFKLIFKEFPKSIKKVSFAKMSVSEKMLNHLCHYCPWVSSVELCYCSDVTPMGLQLIASSLPNLTRIAIKWSLDPDVDVLGVILKACSAELSHVTINGCRTLNDVTLTYAVQAYRSSLIHLDIGNCHHVTDPSLYAIGENCRLLQCLNIEHCDVTNKGISRLLRRCKNLTSVNISHCAHISDTGVVNIAETLNGNFQEFWAKGCARVTNTSLESLISHCPRLRVLCLENTGINNVPPSVISLRHLHTLALPKTCLPVVKGLTDESKETCDYTLNVIREYFKDYAISQRKRVYVIGESGAGKTSLIQLLTSSDDHRTSCADPADTAPVWRTHGAISKERTQGGAINQTALELVELSVSQMDCGSVLFTPNDLYMVLVDATGNESQIMLPKCINLIQARAPGSKILVLGTHMDQLRSRDMKKVSREAMITCIDAEKQHARIIATEIEKLGRLKESKLLKAAIASLKLLTKMRPDLPSTITLINATDSDEVQGKVGSLLKDSVAEQRDVITPQVTCVLQYIYHKRNQHILVLKWTDFVLDLVTPDGIISNIQDLEESTEVIASKGIIQDFKTRSGVAVNRYLCIHPYQLLLLICKLHGKNSRSNYDVTKAKIEVLTMNAAAVMKSIDMAEQGFITQCFLPFLLVNDIRYSEEQILLIIQLLLGLQLLVAITQRHCRTQSSLQHERNPAIQIEGYSHLSKTTSYIITLLHKPIGLSSGIHWPAVPFRDDIQLVWKVDFQYGCHPSLIKLLEAAVEKAALHNGCTYVYRWSGGSVYLIGETKICVKGGKRHIDVICRCLNDVSIVAPEGDDANTHPSSNSNTMEQESEHSNVTVQYMWAQLSPLLEVLHWQLSEQSSGLFYKVYLSALGTLFYNGDNASKEPQFSFFHCLDKHNSLSSTISFNDGSDQKSFDVFAVIPFELKNARDLQDWLMLLRGRREFITGLIEPHMNTVKRVYDQKMNFETKRPTPQLRPSVHWVDTLGSDTDGRSSQKQATEQFGANLCLPYVTQNKSNYSYDANRRYMENNRAFPNKITSTSQSKEKQDYRLISVNDADDGAYCGHSGRSGTCKQNLNKEHFNCIAADIVSMAIHNALIIHKNASAVSNSTQTVNPQQSEETTTVLKPPDIIPQCFSKASNNRNGHHTFAKDTNLSEIYYQKEPLTLNKPSKRQSKFCQIL